MLCIFCDFRRGEYEEFNLLECDAVWLDAANVVPSSLTLSTLTMKEIPSSETSVLTRATWRHIQEDGILECQGRENLKSYMALTGWAF
jgi:hypothetical protein